MTLPPERGRASGPGGADLAWVRKMSVLCAALVFANASFSILRFIQQSQLGRPTGYWINVWGAIGSLCLMAWFAAAPTRRLVITCNLGLGMVTLLLLAPAFYGYASSPWWLVILPLAAASVLEFRQALAWAAVAMVGLVFGLVGVPYLGGPTASIEPLVEGVSSRLVLVFLVSFIALGVRQVSDRRAASLCAAHRVLEETNLHLEEVSRAKTIFLAKVSHEMRTPLNGVVGMTALALDAPLSAEARDCVQTAHESAVSLLGTINDILDLTKIESGRLAIEHIRFDLHAALVDAIRPLFAQAIKKGLGVSCVARAAVRRLRVGDPTRVRQIVSNVVGNAVKFTEKGEIAVRIAAESNGRVVITVSDTGIGIPASRLTAIFEPFTQADDSMTRQFGGTGLGLAIVQQLVTGLEGDVQVTSEVGQGSRFELTLHLPEAEASTPAPKTARRVLLATGNAAREEAYTLQEAFATAGGDVSAIPLSTLALSQAGSAPVETQTGGPRPDVLASYAPDLIVVSAQGAGPSDVLSATRAAVAYFGGVSVVLLVPPTNLGPLASWREAGAAACLVGPLFAEDAEQLLAAPPRPDREEPAAPPSVDWGNGRLAEAACGPHVLVAEDDEVSQRLLCRSLERLGYQVTATSDGAAALEAFEPGRFALVITDLQMPVMDGDELFRRIRARESDSGTRAPIVALTAHAMHGDAERFLSAGFDAYLSKPVARKTLDETVRRFCK